MPIQSTTVTVVAPILSTVWIHDPDDPEGTIQHFRYHESRQETRAVEVAGTVFAGRRYPVYDFGEHSSLDLDVPLQLTLYDDDWDAQMEYLRALLEARKAFIYRDKRGRLIYGITSGLDIGDTAIGAAVTIAIQAADFNEEI